MFDPNKQYQWKLDEKIEFTGKEFHILHDAMQQFIQSALDVPTILKLTQAYAVTVSKMNEYIDKGLINEFTPTEDSEQSA